MSLRGRVLRRKYPEWTLQPKSIQSQRSQLASLLKAFQIRPAGSLVGPLEYLQKTFAGAGIFHGKFPYPDIYPAALEEKLPLETTLWVEFKSYWHYSAVGEGQDNTYYLGYVVVSLADPKSPTVKSSGIQTAGPLGMASRQWEMILPTTAGVDMYHIGAGTGVGDQPEFDWSSIQVAETDRLFVTMAACQKPIPLGYGIGCFSYFVDYDAVMNPFLG